MLFGVALFIYLPASWAQFPEKSGAQTLLRGAIDLHVHSAPDFFDRGLTDIELAPLAEKRGVRAFVIKHHFSGTVERAMLVNAQGGQIRAYGGVVLNRSVGGINPHAVEWMCKTSPEFGKIVWFPTLDAINHRRIAHDDDTVGGFGIPNAAQRISPAVREVLKIIADNDLVLATGHLASNEVIVLVEEARTQHVKNILVTHAMADWPNLDLQQMKRLADAGAVLELTYLSYLSGPDASVSFLRGSKHVSIKDMATAIRTIGAQHFVLSSDLGQTGNPIPPDGLQMFIDLLLEQGISECEIVTMVQTNPARLLGITTK